MNKHSVISVVGLTKVFRDFWRRARVKAVNDLDLEINHGEIFGLLGPNGSGKSTTIKLVLGLLHPTRGRVAVFDRPPNDVKTKSRIGYLPEETYLYRYLNGRQVLDFYGRLFQIHRAERRRRAEELLEMVGLSSAARRPVGEYSKGMARRIGLAQALINDPDLLILDEPTSGLDPIGSKQVKDVILRLGKDFGKTIVLSSHLLSDVEEVCGRVAILYGGVCRAKGALRELLSRRDMTQIVTERLSSETLRAIADLIRQREGKAIDVSSPSDKLESLFQRIVNDARAERLETGGATSGGAFAGFLGEDGQAKAVLDSLVRPATAASDRDEASGGRAAGPDAGVLDDLAGRAKSSRRDEASEPAGSPPTGVDRDVLAGLLEDKDKRGG